jgi:hypothetical protein
LKFFWTLHRAIFEPNYFKEIKEHSRLKVFLFLLSLLLFASVVIGVSRTYYLMDTKKGIPAIFNSALNNLEIKDGLLLPNQPTPYIPPTYLTLPILDIFRELYMFDLIPRNIKGQLRFAENFVNEANSADSGNADNKTGEKSTSDAMPGMIFSKYMDYLSTAQSQYANDLDSFVIIDTAKVINYKIKVPVILLSYDKILFYEIGSISEFSYKDFLFKSENLVFKTDEIHSFLMQHIPDICIRLIGTHLLWTSTTLLLSILFLSFASYIFRLDRRNTFGLFFKFACYAVTPLVIGKMVLAVAGVNFAWVWHLLIFFSTIVLFRGLLAVGNSSADDSKVV